MFILGRLTLEQIETVFFIRPNIEYIDIWLWIYYQNIFAYHVNYDKKYDIEYIIFNSNIYTIIIIHCTLLFA